MNPALQYCSKEQSYGVAVVGGAIERLNSGVLRASSLRSIAEIVFRNAMAVALKALCNYITLLQKASEPMNSTKSRGRPRKRAIDKLRARAWYQFVSSAISCGSDYELEKRFNSNGRSYRCSGKWRRYRRGAMPSLAVIQQVDCVVPGSRRCLDHPFWRIIDSTGLEIDQLHKLMASLRPQVSKILFSRPNAKCPTLARCGATYSQLKALDRVGDLDALTAILGIAREAELSSNSWIHWHALRTALFIYLRIGAFTPLVGTAEAVFDQLRGEFFSRASRYRFRPPLPDLDYATAVEYFNLYDDTVFMMEHLGLFSGDQAERLAFLYVIHTGEFVDVYNALAAYSERGAQVSVRKHPAVGRMMRRLKTHLASRYAYDGIT